MSFEVDRENRAGDIARYMNGFEYGAGHPDDQPLPKEDSTIPYYRGIRDGMVAARKALAAEQARLGLPVGLGP